MRPSSTGAAPAPAPPTTSPSSSRPPRSSGRPKAFTEVLGERVGRGPLPAPPPAPRPPAAKPRQPVAAPTPTPSSVRALLEQTVATERRVDALLAAAARGKTFSPGELLALQATVFRYSQAVEIVSRATDKLVGAVKQTMGTQV
jgi:hypothetical protein